MISRSVLVASLLAFVPLTASAAIDIGGPGDDGGDGGVVGGGGGGGGGGTPPPPPPPDWSRSWNKADYWGKPDWGAGYAFSGSITAHKATVTTKDKLTASANADTYARIDGGYMRLFSARINGSTEAKARTDLSINAYFGSANIFTRSYVSTTSTHVLASYTPSPWTATFFDISADADLFVGVSFRVKATGSLKVNLNGQISNVGIEASAAPKGNAGLHAYAAIGDTYCLDYVGCVGAEAGVYATLNLLSVETPATVAATLAFSGGPFTLTGVRLDYQANAKVVVSSLDGELGVYAKACLVACYEDSAKLVEWNGFTATYNLINVSGSSCLAGTCGGGLVIKG